MTVSVTTSGNGRFSLTGDQSDVIISYDMSESATPLSMFDLSGEIPNMTIAGMSNSVESLNNTHPSSKLLIDNQITLTDSVRGSFTGKVGNLTIDPISVTADVFSKFDKLNVEKKMSVYNGTLKGAFEAYFAEAGLASGDYSVDAGLTEAVHFPSWRDNIWNGLKQLCVAANVEIYFADATIYVKPLASKSVTINDIDNESFTISLGEQTKTTKFTFGKASQVTNGIVFSYATKDGSESVEANEVKDVILTAKVSLSSINQPVNIDEGFKQYTNWVDQKNIGQAVPVDENDDPVYPNGFYVFRDKNGDIVQTDKVTLYGAKVSVELGEEPFEIKMKITGPSSNDTTPWSLEFDDDSAALGLTGSGVFVDEKIVSSATGSSIGDAENEYSGNPFLSSSKYLYNTIYKTNQQVCGPTVAFSFGTGQVETESGSEFGYLPGAIFSYNGSKYRIKTASYDYGQVSITAEQYVTFADFNSTWTGKTFEDLNDTLLDSETYPDQYMKYSDLAIIPLMEPTA